MPEHITATNPQTGERIHWDGSAWVPIGPEKAVAATTDARPPGYKFAETLHRDEQGRTLSFPHMAAPAEPEAQGYAMTAAGLPLGGAAVHGASTAAKVAGRALPFVKPAAGLVKDLIVAQGLEELAKKTGIPGASSVMEVVLAGKIVKTGAKRLLEKSFERWAAKKAAAAVAQTVAPEAVKAAAAAVAKQAAPKAAEMTGGTAGKASVDEVVRQIQKWHSEMKLSDGQIIGALRNVYGVSAPNAKAMLKILAGG